jgi:L-arabonate dehydrase
MSGGLRSAALFDGDSVEAAGRRMAMRAQGYSRAAFTGRPVIGICNTYSELAHCNAHLREVAEAVRRGVLQAGGVALEFPVISLGEPMMQPTTMLYRNLLAMDVESSIKANPLDGVVLLASCDKTVPGCLMGAASADVPAIMVTGGPQLSGHWRGRTVGVCTDCWRYQDELRAGRMTSEEWEEFEAAVVRSPGHCSTMGTASTMACLVEALGMGLPESAAMPAADSRRLQLAEASGRRIVELVRQEVRPRRVLTPEAFENGIRALHAIGGSANAVIHLMAIAGRVGVDLPLRLFDELGRSTPWLADVKPSGRYLMEDFAYAGGMPLLLWQLRELLHLEALTVAGPLGAVLREVPIDDQHVIAPRERPLAEAGSLVVLEGNLCPEGAVLKRTAASPRLLRHEGPAVVFDDPAHVREAVDDPRLEIGPESVLVLRNAGPVGAPGMPECGQLPIPRRLLREGVDDMVRISDGRMSGTGYGTCVVHVCPEAAVGGPLALVRTGDRVRLDAGRGRLDLLVEERELARRRAAWGPPDRGPARGYERLYVDHVLQASGGCDFDFLRGGDAR